MTSRMEVYIRTKRMIKKAFLINHSIPKGYGIKSWHYRQQYAQKERLIEKAILLIKAFSLNIKYGAGVDYNSTYHVIYFDIEGKQFSFHTARRLTSKKYNGVWQGFRNNPQIAKHRR